MKKTVFILLLFLMSAFSSFAQLNVVSTSNESEYSENSSTVLTTMYSYVRVEDGIYYLGSINGAEDRSIAGETIESKKFTILFELKLGNKEEAVEYAKYIVDWVNNEPSGALLTLRQDSIEFNIYKFDRLTMFVTNGDGAYCKEKASEYRQIIAMAVLSGVPAKFTNKSQAQEMYKHIFFSIIDTKIFRKIVNGGLDR